VVWIRGDRLDGDAATKINHRLAAITGLYAFRAMRDPAATNPVPKGRETCWVTSAERGGLLGHLARPQPRSRLRVREPRRLPRPLDREQAQALLGSFHTWRDRAIAGLMLYCGLRAGEVLALEVADVDIGGRWLRVRDKGAKERRVPLDPDVGGLIQTYLLAERPKTPSVRLFVFEGRQQLLRLVLEDVRVQGWLVELRLRIPIDENPPDETTVPASRCRARASGAGRRSETELPWV
jgi:integrase/recombinase XerD